MKPDNKAMEEYIYQIPEDEKMLVAMLRLMEDEEKEKLLEKACALAGEQ